MNEETEKKRITLDGKDYIEFDEAKLIAFSKRRDIIFLFLIGLSLIAITTAIVFVIQNKDIINRDALIIGLEQHGFVNCQCYDEQNALWTQQETGFLKRTVPGSALSGIDKIFFDINQGE